MTTGIPDYLASIPTRRLRFDGYVLDQDRLCLLLDGAEIALRPKTFAVLHFLAKNPARLVSKEELFAAVWPNLAITDDVLVQSIGELRRALGGDGARLIRTIPRRGYRFEPAVIADDLMADAADAPQSGPASHDDLAPSPGQANDRRPRHNLLPNAPGRRRVRLTVLTALLGLAAAALSFVVAARWEFRDVSASGPRATIARPALDARPVLAVLPLTDQSDDPARAYFADGLTQDIINALGRFSAMTVISWNAVLPYKAKPATPQQIGASLGVDYLVEGSVTRSGDRVRVIAQLVDTRRARVLWSARLDEAMAGIFALQDDITTRIAGALAVHVEHIEERRAFAKPTENLAAYDDVLRARAALQHPDRAEIAAARLLLKHAIDLDPAYADAYAALGETYYIATSMGWAEAPVAFLHRAEALSNEALSLSESQERAHVTLGRIDIFYRRFKEAEAELDQAIRINPNDADALAGRGNVLMWSGQTDAAITSLEQAQRLDPDLDLMDRFALSLAYYLAGRYDAAITQAKLNLRQDSGANFSRVVLAAAYGMRSDTGDAALVAAAINRTDPTFDPRTFGTKLLSAADLEHLRDGLRLAGLYHDHADATVGAAGER